MKKRFLILALVAVALVAAGCDQSSNANSTSITNNSAVVMSQNEQAKLALYQNMRKLWTDHVFWTHQYVVTAIAGTPDAQPAATRLLKNQEDIGAAVATYYGKEAGDKLTTLLKEHITIAVDLIADAKAGNQTKFNTDNERWKTNANQIADFLASANPNWPQATLREMMAKHLATTTEVVTDRLEKNYEEDVRDSDAVYEHILMMSDALSDGIIKQFPDKF